MKVGFFVWKPASSVRQRTVFISKTSVSGVFISSSALSTSSTQYCELFFSSPSWSLRLLCTPSLAQAATGKSPSESQVKAKNPQEVTSRYLCSNHRQFNSVEFSSAFTKLLLPRYNHISHRLHIGNLIKAQGGSKSTQRTEPNVKIGAASVSSTAHTRMQVLGSDAATSSSVNKKKSHNNISSKYSPLSFLWNTVSQKKLSTFVLCGLFLPISTNPTEQSFVSAFTTPVYYERRSYSNSPLQGIRDTSKSSKTAKSSNSNMATSLSASTVTGGVLDSIALRLENSWVRELSAETPENLDRSLSQTEGGMMLYNNKKSKNKFKRPVFNGHYVLVEPTGIINPRLVLLSEDVAHNLLSMTVEQTSSLEFVNWVSGNVNLDSSGETWATPYALSIMGTRYTSNCPFGTGDGYGDGRAISIGEFNGYELQLKGAGKTPFCRGADGKAVLRSSMREFLASEAMHALGVPTTRALSLIVSDTEIVNRPWYSEGTKLELPDLMKDPRLTTRYTIEERKQLISQLRESNRGDPNIMRPESAAITCRVATSFVRIGHLDLFARRVIKKKNSLMRSSQNDDISITKALQSSLEWKELEQMIWHACFREYRDSANMPFIGSNDIASAATLFLQQSMKKIATMVAHWIRVGFVQGNFNADNCLVGGNTMDYGPFGYVDEYNPVAAKWTGSGEHFGFMNQPNAGLVNYKILVESVAPVISASSDKKVEDVVHEFMINASAVFENAVDETFRTKLGFSANDSVADTLWEQLEPLIRSSRTDWTVFFRSLSYTIRDFPLQTQIDNETNDKYVYNRIVAALEGTNSEVASSDYPGAFYDTLTEKQQNQWIEWIGRWRKALVQSTQQEQPRTSEQIYKLMIHTNPKYVLREWMLVEAYTASEKQRNDSLALELYELTRHPYDDEVHPQHLVAKYYRRAPDEALVSGGTAFMSCSS